MQAKFTVAGLGLTAALAGLAACSPRHDRDRDAPRAISALVCPSDVGDLQLKSGGDGAQTCTYAGDGGSRVTLQLLALNGAAPSQVLAPIETQLRAEIPPPSPRAQRAVAAASSDDERVDLDLPGLHIHSNGNGAADVDAAGVHVHAHDRDGRDDATVTVGGGAAPGVVIDARGDGAEIRVHENGPGVRLSYLLASDNAGPHGWRTAGYEARGPQGGPLAVAVVLSQNKDADDLRHDVRSLLKRNVGG